MFINPHLIEAARETARMQGDGAAPIEIKWYSGMFVAPSGNADIRPIHFFTEGDKRYALGPKRR